MNMSILSSPSIRFSTIALLIHFLRKFTTQVGNMMKPAIDMTTANRRASAMRMFHAAFGPNFLFIHDSNFPGSSANSGACSSRISADSISVPIPFTKERAKATIPLMKGIFMTLVSRAFFFVFR